MPWIQNGGGERFVAPPRPKGDRRPDWMKAHEERIKRENRCWRCERTPAEVAEHGHSAQCVFMANLKAKKRRERRQRKADERGPG